MVLNLKNKNGFFYGRGEINKTLIYVTLLGLGVYFQDSVRIIFLIISIVYFLLMDKTTSVSCLLCHTFICDNLFIAPAVSYGAIIIPLFFIKNLGNKNTNHISIIIVTFLLIAIQFSSIALFDNEFINVFRFILNLFILIYFSGFSFDIFKRLDTIPVSVSYAVLIGGLISVTLSFSAENLGVIRFSGIWNDGNFCGLYCMLGIISAIYAILYNKWNIFIALPTILISMYMETLAMSRTFIFVIAIVALYLMFVLYNNNKVHAIVKIILTVGVAFLVVVFYNNVVAPVVEVRGIVSEEGGWTNSRGALSTESLQAFFDTPRAWLTGCGITNCVHFKSGMGFHASASHNTYVDLLVELGIPFAIITILYILKYIYRSIKDIKRIDYLDIMCFSMLIYMGTLSLGQYTLFYLIIGVLLNKVIVNNKTSTIKKL